MRKILNWKIKKCLPERLHSDCKVGDDSSLKQTELVVAAKKETGNWGHNAALDDTGHSPPFYAVAIFPQFGYT